MAKKNPAKATDVKKDDAPAQEPTKEPEQAPATVEGAEQDNPEGVVSTEQDAQADAEPTKQPDPDPEQPKAAKGAKGAKYIAQWDLEHNRNKYGAGDEVKDLSDEHAKNLLAIGVIKREG